MKNILKTIVILCLCIANAYAQQDTIPQRDSSHLAQTHKGIISRSANGNYINMDLPGIDLSGADFTPLDDTIAKLNLAGWDVKVIGYYGLSGSMDETVYEDLLSQIRVDKQIIVKLEFDDKLKCEIDLRNSSGNNALNLLIADEIENSLDNVINTLNVNEIIVFLAEELNLLLNNNIGNIISPPNFSNRNEDLDKKPFYISHNNFFLTPSNVAIFLPEGSKAWFFDDNWSCLGKEGFGKGMLFAFELKGEYYYAYGGLDVHGELNMIGYFANYSNESKRKPYIADPSQIIGQGVTIEIIACYSSSCGLNKKHLLIQTKAEDLTGYFKGKCVPLNHHKGFLLIEVNEIKIAQEFNVNHSITKKWEKYSDSLYYQSDCPDNYNIIFSKNYLKWKPNVTNSSVIVRDFENNLLVLYGSEGIIFYSQTNDNAYYYSYKNDAFTLIEPPVQAKERWRNAFVKVVAEETARSAIMIVPAILTGGTATLLQVTLAEAACIGALYIVNEDKGELVINALFLGVGYGLGKYVESTFKGMDDYVLNHPITKHMDKLAQEAIAAKGMATNASIRMPLRIDGKIELVDLKEYESQLSKQQWLDYHTDLKKMIDNKNLDLVEKFSAGKRLNGKLEFEYLDTWKFIHKFPNHRINGVVLDKLINKFGNVLNDIKNINVEFLESNLIHLDLGGHNRYPAAVKIAYDLTDYDLNPIQNHILLEQEFGNPQGGYIKYMTKFKNESIDLITVESATINDYLYTQVNRTLKKDGKFIIETTNDLGNTEYLRISSIIGGEFNGVEDITRVYGVLKRATFTKK